MNKYIPLIILSVIAALILVWFFLLSRDEYTAELAMESDAMAIVNYYYPKRIKLQDHPPEESLKLPETASEQLRFGALHIGNGADSLVSVAFDENSGVLFVDKNNNEDLTDDGKPDWDEDKGDYLIKEVIVDVNYKNVETAVPYPVSFYRYKNRLTDSIMAFRNGYRTGSITLRDSTYDIALLDDDLNGLFDEFDRSALVIDINRDGTLDGNTESPEYYSLTRPFNIKGYYYQVSQITPSGDRITIAAADTAVFPKSPLERGQDAPAFEAQTLDGKMLNLQDYRNKVVLLDFWATWCKPWEAELDELKRNYYKYHHRDFEIIGLSLDYDLSFLREYIEENKIPWPQIADGAGWEMFVAELYKVESLPKNFLLGRRGIIRYKNLYGRNLEAKVYELLNEPEVAAK